MPTPQEIEISRLIHECAALAKNHIIDTASLHQSEIYKKIIELSANPIAFASNKSHYNQLFKTSDQITNQATTTLQKHDAILSFVSDARFSTDKADKIKPILYLLQFLIHYTNTINIDTADEYLSEKLIQLQTKIIIPTAVKMERETFNKIHNDAISFLENQQAINKLFNKLKTANELFNKLKATNESTDTAVDSIFNALINLRKIPNYNSIKESNSSIAKEDKTAEDYIVNAINHKITTFTISTDLNENKTINNKYLLPEEYKEKCAKQKEQFLLKIDFYKYKSILTAAEAANLETQLSTKVEDTILEYTKKYNGKLKLETDKFNEILNTNILKEDFVDLKIIKYNPGRNDNSMTFEARMKALKPQGFSDATFDKALEKAIEHAEKKHDILNEIVELEKINELKSLKRNNKEKQQLLIACKEYLQKIESQQEEILQKIYPINNEELRIQLNNELTEQVEKIKNRLKIFLDKAETVDNFEKSTSDSLENLKQDVDITQQKCETFLNDFNNQTQTTKEQITTNTEAHEDELNKALLEYFNEFTNYVHKEVKQLSEDAKNNTAIQSDFKEFKNVYYKKLDDLKTKQNLTQQDIHEYRNDFDQKKEQIIIKINLIQNVQLKTYLNKQFDNYNTSIQTELNTLSTNIQRNEQIKQEIQKIINSLKEAITKKNSKREDIYQILTASRTLLQSLAPDKSDSANFDVLATEAKQLIKTILEQEIKNFISSDLEENKETNGGKYLNPNDYEKKCEEKQSQLLTTINEYKDDNTLTKQDSSELTILVKKINSERISDYKIAYNTLCDSKLTNFSAELNTLISLDQFNSKDTIKDFTQQATQLKDTILSEFNKDEDFKQKLDAALQSATANLNKKINEIEETNIKNEQQRIAAAQETEKLQKILQDFTNSSLDALKQLNNPNTTIPNCEAYLSQFNQKKESIAQQLANNEELTKQLNKHWGYILNELTTLQKNIIQYETTRNLIEKHKASFSQQLQSLKDNTNLTSEALNNYSRTFNNANTDIKQNIDTLSNTLFETLLNNNLNSYIDSTKEELKILTQKIKQNKEIEQIITNLTAANDEQNKTRQSIYNALITANEQIASLDQKINPKEKSKIIDRLNQQKTIAKQFIISCFEKEMNDSISPDLEKNKTQEGKYLNPRAFTNNRTEAHATLLKEIDKYDNDGILNDSDKKILQEQVLKYVDSELDQTILAYQKAYEDKLNSEKTIFDKKLYDLKSTIDLSNEPGIISFNTAANELNKSTLSQFEDSNFDDYLKDKIFKLITEARTKNEPPHIATESKKSLDNFKLLVETSNASLLDSFEKINDLYDKIKTNKQTLLSQLTNQKDKLLIEALYKKFGLEMIKQQITLLKQELETQGTKEDKITEYKNNILRNINLFITQENDFTKIDVPGDGNCLFSSIAEQLNNKKTKEQIREEVAAYIENNWDQYKWYIDDENIKKATIGVNGKVGADLTIEEKKKYIDYLKRDGTWGDQLSLIAASEIYKINCVVKSLNGNNYDAYISKPDALNTIYLEFAPKEEHYSALRLNDSANKQLIQDIYTDFSSALAKQAVDNVTKQFSSLNGLTLETFHTESRTLLAEYITRLSKLYSTSNKSAPEKLKNLENLKKEYDKPLPNSVTNSKPINPSQTTTSSIEEAKRIKKPTIAFRQNTKTQNIQQDNASPRFDPVIKPNQPAPVIAAQDDPLSPHYPDPVMGIPVIAAEVITGIPIDRTQIDQIHNHEDTANNTTTNTANINSNNPTNITTETQTNLEQTIAAKPANTTTKAQYPANTTTDTSNVTPNNSTNQTTKTSPSLNQTSEANKPSEKTKGRLRRAAEAAWGVITYLPKKAKDFYDNTINSRDKRTNRDPKLISPKLKTKEPAEIKQTVASEKKLPAAAAALQEINGIKDQSIKNQVTEQLSSIQNKFDQIKSLDPQNPTTTESAKQLKSELQTQIESLADLLKTTQNTNMPNLNAFVKDLDALIKKEEPQKEPNNPTLENLSNLNNAIQQENTSPNPTPILAKVAAQYNALLLHNVPQALKAAKKAVNPSIVENNITKDVFKMFCTQTKQEHEKSKSTIKALQEINKLDNAEQRDKLIKQLSSIQDKFKEIKSKNFSKGSILKKSPDEKILLKTQLKNQITELTALLKDTKTTPELNKIVTQLANHANHTSKEENQALNALLLDVNNAIRQDEFVYNPQDPTHFTVVKSSSDLSDHQPIIEGTFDVAENKVKIMSNNLNPTDETIEEMIKLANDLKNTAGDNKQHIEISGCEETPETAIKLYLYGQALELNPVMVDNEDDHTKQEVENFIKPSNTIDSNYTKNLIQLYNEFKDKPITKEDAKHLLLKLQEAETLAVTEGVVRSSISTNPRKLNN